jgi:hypothetical protein
MSEIVKKCKVHGDLTIEQVYKNNDKNLKKGFCYKCKECVYERTRNRPCRKHGELTENERVPSGACRYCSFENLKNANVKRNGNREWFNEKQRLKREADPEKAKKEYKERYKKNVEIYGKDFLNEQKKAQRFGLKPCDIQKMTEEQQNKCAICFRPETRIFTQRTPEREMKVAKLCIDHCHDTGKVRGLLCHDCNTSLGKFKDDIQILQSAIEYLKKHKDKSDAFTST